MVLLLLWRSPHKEYLLIVNMKKKVHNHSINIIHAPPDNTLTMHQYTHQSSYHSFSPTHVITVNTGCVMVEGGAWKTAPLTATIVGLQGIPAEDNTPLYHSHICFGYAYNQQSGWKELLTRFVVGGGSLLDIAHLVGM